MSGPNASARKHPLATPVLILLLILAVFTPLFHGGLTPLAGLVSQLIALALLTLVLWAPSRLVLRPPEAILLVLLLLVPVVYLLPLPAQWIDALPGRTLYTKAQALLASADANGGLPLSLVPSATVTAGLALLLPVAAFLGVRCLDERRILTLLQLVLAIAAIQAIIGVIQFGTAQTGNPLLAIDGGHAGSGTGLYLNRNHLAGLLEMVLPIALALFFFSLGRGEASQATGRWRRKAAFVSSVQGHAALIYGALAVLLVIGAVFSRSRTGIFLTMLGILLSTFLFARRIGGSNAFGSTGTLFALAGAFAVTIGLAPVLERFSVSQLADEGRWPLFERALQGAATFFPFGSGPGTFPSTFPPFQPLELGNVFVNRAHNDYIEWLFDAGAVGVAIPLAIFLLYLYQWTRVYSAGAWPRARFLQAGAGIGLLLLALHEFVDYNLYTPANQLVFAILAGLFFMPPARLAQGAPEHRRRTRRTQRLETPAAPESPAAAKPPPDQIENPFRTPPTTAGEGQSRQHIPPS